MLSRLSPRTIYERFHAPYPSVPGWALPAWSRPNHDKEALWRWWGGDRGPRHVRARVGGEAELAVVVEDGWRSRGIGGLLDELAAKARSRGIDLFTGPVLGENRRALGALAAVFPGMRYGVRDGAYQVRAPLQRGRWPEGLRGPYLGL